MSIDKDKLIAAQAIMKSLIDKSEPISVSTKFDAWDSILRRQFAICIKIVEEYATENPDDEWINTGVRVPKAYWDSRDDSLIMEGNRPQKTEKGWFIFTQKKAVREFKKFIEAKEGEI